MAGIAAPQGRDAATAFAIIAALYFLFGFVTSSVDILVPVVRRLFTLSYREAVMTQFAFFMAYGLFSLPAAALLARIGYARALIAALVVMVAGCACMALATRGHSYNAVLVALFVIASGITLIQVSANPLVTLLGSPERSHARMSLGMGFNSLGTIVGPYLGGLLILRGGVFQSVAGETAARTATFARIEMAFVGIAVLALLLAALIWIRRDRFTAAGAGEGAAGNGQGILGLGEGLRSRWALAGAGAIFLYVGSEISILSLMINFLVQPSILGWSHAAAATLLAVYGIGRMSGRFVGSFLMTRIAADRLLVCSASTVALLCLIVSQSGGLLAAVTALSIGLFTSITFPAVFSLTMERSTAPRPAVSGMLATAIVGGALVPLGVAAVADRFGLSSAFLPPAVAFLFIVAFAARAGKARKLQADAMQRREASDPVG